MSDNENTINLNNEEMKYEGAYVEKPKILPINSEPILFEDGILVDGIFINFFALYPNSMTSFTLSPDMQIYESMPEHVNKKMKYE